MDIRWQASISICDLTDRVEPAGYVEDEA